MANNEAWSGRVLAAAKAVGEKAWPLPMFPLYSDMIKSDVADIKNTGGSRYGGAITAAKFLEEFVGDVPWVHLDIAGPAWAEHENPTRDSGGTGCFVRTLVELALARMKWGEHLLYDDSEWTDEELRLQLARSAQDNGWNEPGMEAYDRYDEELRKRCPQAVTSSPASKNH